MQSKTYFNEIFKKVKCICRFFISGDKNQLDFNEMTLHFALNNDKKL